MTADFINDSRFHQSFVIPPDAAQNRHEPFKVTFADYGYRNLSHPEEEHVLLFCGSLMSSRLLHIVKDSLAKDHKVRIINPDRPGLGGTSSVTPGHDRVAAWTEAVFSLLKHLNIAHVSLACHSGGTVYAFDLILRHPEILHPERPYLAIGAPWILPSHTDLTLMSITQHLPSAVLSQTDKFARAINDYVGPAIGRTIGISQSLLRSSNLAVGEDARAAADSTDGHEHDLGSLEIKLRPSIMDRAYAESVQGISSEAVLLMQKSGGWGDWGDYDVYVPRLADALRSANKKIKVHVFYAEKDALVGNGKGVEWFDRCWSAEQCEGVVDYSAVTVPGVDHDSIWDIQHGVVQQVLKHVGDCS